MTTRSQLGGSDGIRTCEEGNLVAEPDQFFGQVRNDALSAAVQPLGNAFDKKGAICAIFMMTFPNVLAKANAGIAQRFHTTGVGSGIAARALLSAGIVSRRLDRGERRQVAISQSHGNLVGAQIFCSAPNLGDVDKH